MRWWQPVVDRDDDFTPFLTAHLPVRVTLLRRAGWVLVLAGFGVALGAVVAHGEQVQLAGTTAGELAVYLLLLDLPTRRLHRYSRVGTGYTTLHVLATVALVAWTWLLPLPDAGAGLRGATVLGGLRGSPHPDPAGPWRVAAWVLGGLAVAGGITLHVLVQRLGRSLATSPGDTDADHTPR
ncbi:hypothetical protein [uncultured Jatrophihabitans sp.]|uniref:hypothetical protein n=1 Tax=uncultured Jatrophihabitans sp. TaxID=1610747 RepID=UPI0035CBABCD